MAQVCSSPWEMGTGIFVGWLFRVSVVIFASLAEFAIFNRGFLPQNHTENCWNGAWESLWNMFLLYNLDARKTVLPGGIV